jgi:hypothetical protein
MPVIGAQPAFEAQDIFRHNHRITHLRHTSSERMLGSGRATRHCTAATPPTIKYLREKSPAAALKPRNRKVGTLPTV